MSENASRLGCRVRRRAPGAVLLSGAAETPVREGKAYILKRYRGRVFILSSLFWLVARAVIFFFLFSLLLFLLYLLGNFQEFLDSTQVFLLQLLKVSLLAEVFVGLLYIILVFFLRRQRRLYVKLILCSLSVVFCYLLLLAFSFLSAWFQL
jgi:hypothetical protein